jgi:signal transduction histidine kinase
MPVIRWQLRPVGTGLTLALPRRHPIGRSVPAMAFGLAFLFCALISAAAAEPRRVLMLHSLGTGFAPFGDFAEGFREELVRQSPEPIDFYDASLEAARFKEGDREAPFVDYLLALFGGTKLDLVVNVGASAARFAQRNRSRLFASVPMILAVEQRRVDSASLTVNDAVVSEKVDLSGIISNILRVLPDTNNVAVVIGNSPLENFWLEEMRREFQPFANRVNFQWFDTLSLGDMRKRVAALPPRSAIFYAMLVVDAAGVPHKQELALAALRAAANAPIFSFSEGYFGHGIVGGPLNSHQDLARLAAGVAVRILRGETPGEIRTAPLGPNSPTFDQRELQRWHISEALLPAGSTVLFREPTLWHRYGIQALVVLAALLIQAAIIGWLLIERRRRRVAELESRGRLQDVIHLDRVAAVGAISASIAHELNQPLGAILLNAETAALLLAANPIDRDQLKAIIADIRQSDQQASEIIAHLRGLLKKQSEADLRGFDLNDAIRDALHALAPEARKRGVVVSAYQAPGALMVLADQIHLEQVILNLATNAMDAMENCAPAMRKMTLESVLVSDSEVEVSVSDCGTGIPSDKLKGIFETFYTTKQAGTGLGLSIVRTIVETYGGKIRAENRRGGGAVFRFTLPLTKLKPA